MAKKSSSVIGPIFQIRDLTAGVNLRPSATNIKPGQARRLLNTLISNQGELAMYPGHLTWMSAIGAHRIQGAKRVYLDTSTFTTVVTNGNVYTPADNGAAGSIRYSGLSATNEVDIVHDRDIAAVFDGINIPVKSFDGTTWTQLGIAPPIAAPTPAVFAFAGTLPDAHTFSVSYAYFSASAISNESAAGTATTLSPALTVLVNVVASTDPQVTGIKIYAMDVTAGETVRRLTATLANATVVHQIETNNWDAQEEAPTGHDVAEPLSFGCVWKNRWWGRDVAVKNRLRFSEIFQPQSWPVTYYVDIPFQRGEDIMAVAPSGDTLVVFGYSQANIINGQTSLDFEVRPALGGQAGAVGFRAVDSMEGGIVHAGAPGLYLFNGASDELLSYSIEPAWHDFIENSSPAAIARLPVVYHKTTKELRVAVPRLYPAGTMGEWIMDLNRGKGSDTGPAWFSTDRIIGGYYQYDGEEASSGDTGRIFSWYDGESSAIIEERIGVTANGSDRVMEYDGFMLPFGYQVARIIESYLEYQPANGTATVDLRVDGRLQGSQSFTPGVDLPRYGTATYHVSAYAGSSDRDGRAIVWPITAEGRTAQLLFRFVGPGDFRIYTYGHNAIPEALPRGI